MSERTVEIPYRDLKYSQPGDVVHEDDEVIIRVKTRTFVPDRWPDFDLTFEVELKASDRQVGP